MIVGAPQIAKWITDTKSAHPGLTDPWVLEGLIQPVDAEAEWVIGRNNYVFFYLVGRYFRPLRIIEIGTRFGYSLWAVVKGADRQRRDTEITIYDAELDADKEPLKVCENWFRAHEINNLHIHRQNTQSIDKLTVPHPVDLATVDANHSEAGAYWDCCLAWEVLKPGGVLIIDDTNPGSVQRAAERFAAEKGVAWGFLPSLRGIHLLLKPE